MLGMEYASYWYWLCVWRGGGRKIIYISQNILSQSVHSFTFPGFLAEDPLQSEEKKKHTAQHEPLFIAHIGEEGGMAAVEDILPCL